MRTGLFCRMVDFGNFLNGFAYKPHDWSSWILTECNLSWKLVKYRIPSEVCMINSTVLTSDVMYKNYKRLVQTPPDLLARICKVNLSNAKQFGLTCFPRSCFRGLIYCDLECDRRCLLFFLCTIAIRLSIPRKMFHS